MPSTYEIWLSDDSGNRIALLSDYAFLSYSRSAIGFGTLEIGLPYLPLAKRLSPVFQPDRMIEVWRSPDTGYPLRLEQVYFLRKPKIYTRQDGMQLIVFYGRDPKDLLRRRYVVQASGTSWTRKTDYADDMMKEIVTEQMLHDSALDPDGVVDNSRAYPDGEFFVQGELSLGPTLIQNFADRNVLDVLKDIRDATEQKALEDVANRKIYFDVVPLSYGTREIAILDEEDSTLAILDEAGYPILDETSSPNSSHIGFRFETFAGLRGQDRTQGVIFSQENNNLKDPYYTKSHLEEINTIIVKGFGRGDSREYDMLEDNNLVNASRWNRCEGYVDASNEPDQTNLADAGRDALWKGAPDEEISAVFLNVPGGPDSPRSLYGVDWDMGDLLPVEYAGRRFNVEVEIVYVSLNESGEENISGRNRIDAAD